MFEVAIGWIFELLGPIFFLLRYILGEVGSLLVICVSIITVILTGVFAVKFFLKKKYLLSIFYFIVFFAWRYNFICDFYCKQGVLLISIQITYIAI